MKRNQTRLDVGRVRAFAVHWQSIGSLLAAYWQSTGSLFAGSIGWTSERGHPMVTRRTPEESHPPTFQTDSNPAQAHWIRVRIQPTQNDD